MRSPESDLPQQEGTFPREGEAGGPDGYKHEMLSQHVDLKETLPNRFVFLNVGYFSLEQEEGG